MAVFNGRFRLVQCGLTEAEADLVGQLLSAGVPVIAVGPGDVPRQAWRDVRGTGDCRLDLFRQGDGLLAIGGHGVDVVDVDPKNGGSIHELPPFKNYGVNVTPSGGRHYLVPSCGLPGGALPGVGDYCGGKADGTGRKPFFLPGSRRTKYPNGGYEVETVWDLEGCLEDEPDEDLVEELKRALGRGRHISSTEWDPAEEITEEELLRAREILGRAVDALVECKRGNGRNNLLFKWLAILRQFVLGGFLEESLVHDRMLRATGEDIEAEFESVWTSAGRAAERSGPARPRLRKNSSALDDFGKPKPIVDSHNMALATRWLVTEIGSRLLSGMFARDNLLVHTPRMGEEGYVPPANERWEDGPAQVRSIDAGGLRSKVQLLYDVRTYDKEGELVVPKMFSTSPCEVVVNSLELMPNLRELRGVTHTPMLLKNGDVLGEPGYEGRSGWLYLPTGPEVKAGRDVEGSRKLIDLMLCDFPWNTVHDKANYLALLFTPMMRLVAPPPYPLGAINAHQAGSGKSFLARILRELYGGVLRGDVPADEAEFKKQVTSVLYSTTGAIVQWDNVKMVGGPSMDALHTSATWTDRLLGSTKDVTLQNDRLWVCTGNNIAIRGDLRRRLLWVNIDPNMEHPEQRVEFAVEDLMGWVVQKRGELLRALLTLCSGWAKAGMPMAKKSRSDDYAFWNIQMQGLIDWAGWPGIVGHKDTLRAGVDEDTDSWADFLELVEEQMGDDPWMVKDLVAALTEAGEFSDRIPYGMDLNSPRGVGRWLMNREGVWGGGRVIRRAKDTKNGVVWQLRNK